MNPPDEPRKKRGRPPAKPHERLRHVVQLRLNNAQYTFAWLMAEEWKCSMGEAIRRIIDESLDSDPREIDGMTVNGEPARLRQALEIASPTPEWIAEQVQKHGED